MLSFYHVNDFDNFQTDKFIPFRLSHSYIFQYDEKWIFEENVLKSDPDTVQGKGVIHIDRLTDIVAHRII